VATANYLRAMISGGISSLHAAPQWDLGNVLTEKVREEYSEIVSKILDSLDFMSVIDAQAPTTQSVYLFSAHEGLILDYEAALTEKEGDSYYDSSAHFLWIGDRTRQINGAHVEFFRGIENPIGVKVGPSMKTDELQELIKILNPKKEPGRLTLITRYGSEAIEDILPQHIDAVKETDTPVLWICDPCHGNTEVKEGIKTRNIAKVMKEMELAFRIHSQHSSRLGGVHLELTGDDVTECIGGSCDMLFDNLSTKYESFCDPRLNYTQSLDFAFSIAKNLSAIKNKN